MKQFLRLLLAAGIIAFAASMLAVSCGKTAGGGGTTANNNSGGGSGSGGSGGNGGGNGGGGTPQPQVGPPAIALTNFETNSAKLVAGTMGALDTIKLKASTFPQTSALAYSTNTFSDFATANAGLLKRVFDITITGGNAGDATGGLIIVGGGNIDRVNNFSDLSGGVASSGTVAVQRAGFISAVARSTAQPHQPAGWSFFGLFIDDTTPTVANADSQPFAFTPSDTGGGSFTHPIMFCRATITTITSSASMGAGSIQANTTFAGGQTAHCYIASKGSNFIFGHVNGWLNTPASATFKKTFNIAIGGFRTDAKTVSQFMPGTDDAAKIAALADGLNSREITAITTDNPSAYKKVAVTIVSDADF